MLTRLSGFGGAPGHLARVLLDPTPVEGGGGTDRATEPAPQEAEATKGQEKAPQKPTPIQVDPGEYAALWQRLQAAEAAVAKATQDKEDALAAERNAALAKIAEKDGVEAALKQQKADLEAQFQGTQQKLAGVLAMLQDGAKKSIVDAALVGLEFIDPNAADFVRAQLAGRFATEPVEGQEFAFRVRDVQTGQFATADSVRAAIQADPKFAWTLKSKAAPGTRQGDTTVRPGQTPEPDAELSPAERALKALAARRQDTGGRGLRPPAAP